MKPGLIAQAWLSYRSRVLPQDAPSIQVIECRRAFYAGAQAFWTEMQALSGPGSDATADEARALDSLQQELRQFARSVEAGAV